MKIKQILIIIVLLFSGSLSSAWAEQEIWKTSFPNTLDLNYAITKALADKFDATLQGKRVPFARRLNQLQTGEIDLSCGLFKNAVREKYAYFLSPPYSTISNKLFFMRKGEGYRLQKFEDLYSLLIGVKIHSKYYPRFDADKKLRKYATTRDESRFNMLIAHRIDAVIQTDLYGFATLRKMGLEDKIEIAPYRYTSQNPVYMAISRKSKLMKQTNELEQVFQIMVESGEIRSIIERYMEREQHLSTSPQEAPPPLSPEDDGQ
ncbi:substrate-binding periplasmic protein [Desulfogranum japonicum]|uniref:substrate-binding periplasmic protein n=1 Tax=Desulfogranum japonicum TaxID=231447 RepID=UPI00048E1FE6|nr:transporter substrate-binding domain-containing protein [Desulfogranum japonicum]